MTIEQRPIRRRTRRRPKPLTSLIDDVLRRAGADLAEEEAVHDLRVACRRLEAATRVNSGVLRRAELRDLRDAAKTIRRAFDEARDLEVIAAEIDGIDGLSPAFRAGVRAAAGTHAGGARSRGRVTAARKAIEAARTKLTAEMTPGRDELAATLAAHINAFFDELDHVLDVSSDDALHEARIAAKRLRYEMEIAAPAFPRLRAQVTRLKRLQDILGRHQDAAVGLAWAEALSGGALAATAADRATTMHYYDRLRRAQRARLRGLLREWRLLDMRGRFLKAIGVKGGGAEPDTTGIATAAVSE